MEFSPGFILTRFAGGKMLDLYAAGPRSRFIMSTRGAILLLGLYQLITQRQFGGVINNPIRLRQVRPTARFCSSLGVVVEFINDSACVWDPHRLSGFNLYATVLPLGLLQRFNLVLIAQRPIFH